MTLAAVVEAAASPSAFDLIEAVRGDAEDRRNSLGLAAFENVLSRTARAMFSVELADRYLIGNHQDRCGRNSWVTGGLMCTGYPAVDALERAAAEAAQAMFGAGWIDFRPLSGLHATVSTICAMTRPGDGVYSIAPDNGGHFATRALLESTGRSSEYISWSPEMTVDLEAFARQWSQRPGRMVLFDHGVPLRRLPVAEVRAIIGPDALLVYDASHTLGLVAGGEFQDPLREGCDVLQGNTHKSFPGAHKGLIAFADADLGRRISALIGATLVSSQNTGATLANFVTVLEMAQHARSYARQMQANRAALVRSFTEHGARFHVPSGSGGASESHVVLVEDVAGQGGYELAGELIAAGLHVNARSVGERTVLRLGVQEVTRLGMDTDDMAVIAGLLGGVAHGEPVSRVRTAVTALRRAHRHVQYSFDANPASLRQCFQVTSLSTVSS